MDDDQIDSIQTESLGFTPLAGDAKVQLTDKWSPPPAPTASLLAIASRKGIVAAGGPDAIYINPTDNVRKAFDADKNGDTEIRPFETQIKIPMSVRISHLAFTPDEEYVIMSAEQGGGLAIYETQTLLQGSGQTAFEISTNGETIKELAPNPMPELAEFCAVVTNNGSLLIANLKQKALVPGPSGPVLRSGVTSVGWSTKGKQLVAGLRDGSIVQLTPDGVEKAQIPKPDSLGEYYVASIAWLENHLFLAVYNETNGSPPNSEFFAITRQGGAGQSPSFDFRKLMNPVPSFEDTAPHPTVLRIKDHPPSIQDLLIVASSTTGDLGLLTKAKAPLATDKPADRITNVLLTTEFTDDSRRAALPSDEEFNDTYPVGFALDLSSQDKLYKPVPTDQEIDYSPGPLPAVWALNKDGVLAAWWMVYYDAVKEGVTYPGMAALRGEPAPQAAVSAPAKPAFGAQPATSSFGTSAFGGAPPALVPSSTTSSGPTFGAPSSLGGSHTGPAFGQAGGLGSRTSPWATGNHNAAPAFGSHGFASSAVPTAGGSTGDKVFGSAAGSNASASGGGFAALAGQSGFASLAGGNGGSGGGSIFAKPSSSSTFGSASSGQSVFGGGNQSSFGSGKTFGSSAFGSTNTSTNSGSAFGASASNANGGSSFGASPFVLGTTFKADPATANDNEKPTGKSGFSLGGFGLSLGDSAARSPAVSETKDDPMTVATPVEQEKVQSFSDKSQGSTTPTSTPAPTNLLSLSESNKPRSNPFGGPATTSSLFGASTTKSDAPIPNPFAKSDTALGKPTSSIFGNTFNAGSTKPNPFAQSKPTSTQAATGTSEPPLPPDTTSKAAYPFEESSASSVASTNAIEDIKQTVEKVDDAPLPPDFLAPKSKPESASRTSPSLLQTREKSPVPEEAPLPPDFITKLPKSSSIDPSAAPTVPEDSGSDLSEEGESDDQGENEDDFDDEDEEEEDAEGSEEEDGSEGSGIDVAKDLSPTSADAGQNTGATPQSSFGGVGGSTFSLVSRPDAAQPSRPSIFGNGTSLFSKPGPTSSGVSNPSHGLGLPKKPSPFGSSSGLPPRPQASGFSKSISSRVEAREDPNIALQRQAQKKQAEQEQQYNPEDDEYEQVQALLESPVDPTMEIGEFNAFISLTANAHASTIAAQVEALYRDMNGMLATLGLNARALAGFIQGHEERKPDHKTKGDLENMDDWILCEAEDLDSILDDELARDLEDGRVHDFQDTWDTCQDLERETQKLRQKKQDLKRILDNVLDPDQAATARVMPLNAEQAVQQNELRQSYARVITLIADAESALTMLKTKLATVAGKPNAVPTVDAIMRTISRMTSAFEKRSGEIDILESQVRKLRISGSLPPSSREGTPEIVRTPPTNRRLLLAGRGRGSTHSPSPLRSSVNGGSSGGRNATPPPHKKLAAFTPEEKAAVRDKMRKRQDVLNRLRGKLVEQGPKMSKMTDTH